MNHSCPACENRDEILNCKPMRASISMIATEGATPPRPWPAGEEMVISVPHTGTRSLRDHLGLDGYWHFGQNDDLIAEYAGRVHFPVRDPLNVSLSWEARYPTEHRHLQEFKRWESAFEYLHFRSDVFYYKIEDLPVHIGKGAEHWTRHEKNRDKLLKLDRIIYLRKWMTGSVPSQFFGRFYPEGFWWL